jgi:hypothetical protein
MTTISRSRRAAIKRAATEIRHRCLSGGHGVEDTAETIRSHLPEVRPLEAWRLALGWPRSRTVERVAALYRSRGLLPPGLSESMLCRWEHRSWEHRSWERPGVEYAEALRVVYAARPEQLGLGLGGVARGEGADDVGLRRYSAGGSEACVVDARESMVTMSTAAGLPAVRESLHLALLAEPRGSAVVVELAGAAVEHYALGYSKHPPHVLFAEVHGARHLLTRALAGAGVAEPVAAELRRTVGRLSALLGNLTFHLDDPAGARVHLGTAATYGARTGDARLAAWAWGAQAMVARSHGEHTTALAHADRALALAPAGLARAQALAWARLPSLAALGRHRDADTTLADAAGELAADPAGRAPGRFGYDDAEHALHEADAHRALGRTDRATACADRSLAATLPGSPAWAAAGLVLAQAEATTAPGDAAQRALEALTRVPAARLRSTSRARLTALTAALNGTAATGVADLRDRVHALPAAIDAHGNPAG